MGGLLSKGNIWFLSLHYMIIDSPHIIFQFKLFTTLITWVTKEMPLTTYTTFNDQ